MQSAALHSIAGFFALHLLAWVVSERRGVVAWRAVISGMALTFGLGVLLLKVPPVSDLFLNLNGLVTIVETATREGTSFVFGYLGGGPLPFEEKQPGASFVFAFRVLPLVLVISALSSLLFYLRILPLVVRAFSFLLTRSMGVGGAVGLSSAANVFVGMVEAPLFVRPYIRNMTRSALFVMMTCGMATIAGTVMVLYASVLGRVIPDVLGHLLIASIISTPAAIAVALLMVPMAPGDGPPTEGDLVPSQEARSAMDAITKGTVDGVSLLVNIIAMLVVLVALVALANQVLALLPPMAGAPVTMQRLLGYVMAPLVWVMGIPWGEAPAAGALMGTKTVLNEFIAYVDLANLPMNALSNRSELMMTYALCGFANFGSLGIMIGGLATMAPGRRGDIVSLGAKTLVSGTLATLITGSVVGILY